VKTPEITVLVERLCILAINNGLHPACAARFRDVAAEAVTKFFTGSPAQGEARIGICEICHKRQVQVRVQKTPGGHEWSACLDCLNEAPDIDAILDAEEFAAPRLKSGVVARLLMGIRVMRETRDALLARASHAESKLSTIDALSAPSPEWQDERIKALTAERDHLAEQLGLVYWHVTDGKLSKPYDFKAVESEIDDCINEHINRTVEERLKEERPTGSEQDERVRDFVQELADEPCNYGDNCPTFGTRHGTCLHCKARAALASPPPLSETASKGKGR
jgi:hypothetical protein